MQDALPAFVLDSEAASRSPMNDAPGNPEARVARFSREWLGKRFRGTATERAQSSLTFVPRADGPARIAHRARPVGFRILRAYRRKAAFRASLRYENAGSRTRGIRGTPMNTTHPVPKRKPSPLTSITALSVPALSSSFVIHPSHSLVGAPRCSSKVGAFRSRFGRQNSPWPQNRQAGLLLAHRLLDLEALDSFPRVCVRDGSASNRPFCR